MENKNIVESYTIICHVLLNFLLDPISVGHMSCISKTCARRINDANYYQMWLQRYENGVFRDPGRASSENYFAAQLFRCFLRKVQCRFGESVVVAGDLAVNYLLHTFSFANDVEIFVTKRRHKECIVSMYVDNVLKPLRTPASPVLFNHGYLARVHEDQEVLGRKLDVVRGRIRTDIDAFIRLLNLQGTGNDSNVKLATLRHTADHMPQCLVSASYKVIQTFRLTPTHSTVARPLNIKTVCVRGNRNETAFARTICTSFDLQHCAISLKTADNFSFQYDCFDRSQECALQRRLELRPTSFIGLGLEQPIMTQLSRIWKYIQQGYTWSINDTNGRDSVVSQIRFDESRALQCNHCEQFIQEEARRHRCCQESCQTVFYLCEACRPLERGGLNLHCKACWHETGALCIACRSTRGRNLLHFYRLCASCESLL